MPGNIALEQDVPQLNKSAAVVDHRQTVVQLPMTRFLVEQWKLHDMLSARIRPEKGDRRLAVEADYLGLYLAGQSISTPRFH